MNEHRLWSADPHQYGPGKVHIVDNKEETKTLCGRFLSAIPGRRNDATQATCRVCLDAVIRRPEQERQRQEWERRRVETERQRSEENEQWQARYQVYLRSPVWAERRRKVLDRASGTCEGCLSARATEVHHVTYAHVGEEFLWELRAICRSCHERVTDLNRKVREATQ
jgi:5-methylcytosine-specific restriction endonuclease McrA